VLEVYRGGDGLSSGTSGSHGSSSSGRRRRNDDRAGGDVGYSVRLRLRGAVTTFLCCLANIQPRWQMVLTWFFVIAVGVLGGAIEHSTNIPFSIPASPSDEIIITSKSPLFCRSLTLAFYTPLDYYALTKPLQIDTNYRVKFSRDVSSCILPNVYDYWGFYLLEGSRLSLRFDIISGTGTLAFYAIQGEDNLQKWMGNSDCLHCYIAKRERNSDTVNLNITETSQYYFAFANQEMYDSPCSDVSVRFRIVRTRYTRAKEEPLCLNSSKCSVEYPVSGSRVVVVDIPFSASFLSSINVSCHPRLYMYVIVFGICPVFLGGVVTCILYRKSIKRRQASVSGRSFPITSQNNAMTASQDRQAVVNTTDVPSQTSYLRSPVASAPPLSFRASNDASTATQDHPAVCTTTEERQANIVRPPRYSEVMKPPPRYSEVMKSPPRYSEVMKSPPRYSEVMKPPIPSAPPPSGEEF